MLGIMIGIAAFISTVAIGEGGSNRIREQLQNLGDNFVWVEAGSRNFQGVRTGSGNNTSLTERDAQAILNSVSLIKSVSPQVDARVQVIYGNVNWNTVYRGVTPEFLSIRRWTLDQGASFTQRDVEVSANVCLLGKTVADRFFNSYGKGGLVGWAWAYRGRSDHLIWMIPSSADIEEIDFASVREDLSEPHRIL